MKKTSPQRGGPNSPGHCHKLFELLALRAGQRAGRTLTDFKGVQYPRAAILHTVSFYVRYAVSYRDLEDILTERSVLVNHAKLNRWVVNFSSLIAANAHARNNLWPLFSAWMKLKVRCEVGGLSSTALLIETAKSLTSCFPSDVHGSCTALLKRTIATQS